MKPDSRHTKILTLCFILLMGALGICFASDVKVQKTMLMFVGEDKDILSIASGREESAWQAPAVASVLDREMIMQNTDLALSNVLDSVSGFHIRETDTGIGYYLRGIPGSVLLLYDTVSMGSADDVSLHAAKRVEVVRGPGSVLWGPDAFAGIVNVVPMTGKDLQGSESGVLFSTQPSKAGGYLNHGWSTAEWDGFVSISGNRSERKNFQADISRFWGEGDYPVPPDDRTGFASKEYGQALELVGNFLYKDLFTLSGRFSESTTPYSFSSPGEGNNQGTIQQDAIRWKELEVERTGFIKIEGKREFGIDSALRITGTASMVESDKTIIDKDFDRDEYDIFAEMIYETAMGSGDSLLTTGISYRREKNVGVLLWSGYLPDYLVDENFKFLPQFEQNSYTTNLLSLFLQYRKTLGAFDFLLGVRNDDHDSFEDHISYNGGVTWSPTESWMMKVLMGTSYRTPSPKRLYSKIISELEEIRSINLEVSKKIGKMFRFSACGFINEIENHMMDDPYAGLSDPNSQKTQGVEFELSFSPVKSFSLSAGFTIMDNTGPSETYQYNDYSYPGPDGSLVKHYVALEYPYDRGPDRLFNIRFEWNPSDRISMFSQTKYYSGYPLTYPHAVKNEISDNVCLTDIGITIKKFIHKKADLTVNINNVFDNNYATPGSYNLEKGESLNLGVLLRIKW